MEYGILKLLYGAKKQRWKMRAYLRYIPVVYGVGHAYKYTTILYLQPYYHTEN